MSTKLAFNPLNHTKSTSRKVLSLQCEKHSNRYKLNASSGILHLTWVRKIHSLTAVMWLAAWLYSPWEWRRWDSIQFHRPVYDMETELQSIQRVHL